MRESVLFKQHIGNFQRTSYAKPANTWTVKKLKSLAMPIMVNYYDILGVPCQANADEIKSAYRRLAMQLHPDRNQGESEQFHLVNKAYSTLGDPQKRAQYDAQLKTPLLRGPTQEHSTEQVDEVSVSFIEEMAELTKSLLKQGQSKAFILGALYAKGAPAKIANKLYAATHSRYRANLTGWPKFKAHAQEKKHWAGFVALGLLGLGVAALRPAGPTLTASPAANTNKAITEVASSPVAVPEVKQSPFILKALPKTAEFEAGRVYFEGKPLELTPLKTLDGPQYNQKTELFAAKPAQGQDYSCENCSVLVLARVTGPKTKTTSEEDYLPLAFFGGHGQYKIPKQSGRFVSYGINRRALMLHDSYRGKGVELEMASLFDIEQKDPLLGVVFLKEDNLRSAECREQHKCQNYRAQFSFDSTYEDLWPLRVRLQGLLSAQNDDGSMSTNEVSVLQTWLYNGSRYKPASQVNLMGAEPQ